jgi:presenilin 1
MVLAALATIYINTEESQAEGEEALSGTYNVYSTGNADNSNGQQLGESLINGIVIVSVICAMTFLIVLLYKYRCMKLLIGYMLVASVMLLGFLSAVMFQVAIDRYQLKIDAISFYLFIYNFCIVGTTAIFFAKGFPVYITQGYLIATSVIVSWQ